MRSGAGHEGPHPGDDQRQPIETTIPPGTDLAELAAALDSGPMDADLARKLTDEIKQVGETLWMLVVVAYGARAWTALGYESWDAYCTAEFDSLRGLRLPREERRQTVASLRDAGFSLRAISSATGISKTTAQNDVQVYQSGTPARVTGTDGKTYQPGQSRTYPENSIACAVEKPSTLIRDIKADLDRLMNPQIYSLGMSDLNKLDAILKTARLQVGNVRRFLKGFGDE